MVDNIIKEFLAEKEQEKKDKGVITFTNTYEFWHTTGSTTSGITNTNLGSYYIQPVILSNEHGFTYGTLPNPSTTTIAYNPISFNEETNNED